jgi:Flp pilus assembly protein TadG
MRRKSSRSTWSGARRSDAGALTLSYVILVPVFLAALMLVVQGAIWYLAEQAALGAARQGVDAARVRGGTPGAGVRAAVGFARSAASGFLLGPSASAAGGTVRVAVITVTGTVPTVFPGIRLPAIHARVAAPVERFTVP